MKSILAKILLLCFIAVSVFGYVGMSSHARAHDNEGCIASISSGRTVCAEERGGLDFAIFHINVFKSFSLAVIGESISGLILIFIVFIFSGKYLIPIPNISLLSIFHSASLYFLTSALNFKKRFSYWLSLHENSPQLSLL